MSQESKPYTFTAVHRPKPPQMVSQDLHSSATGESTSAMAPTKAGETDSEWDFCDDATTMAGDTDTIGHREVPDEVAQEEPESKDKISAKMKKLAISKGSNVDTSLRTAHPDPKFYPADDSNPNQRSNREDTYPEGDRLRRTLALMGFAAAPSSLPKSFLRAATNRFTPAQVRQFTADLQLGYSNPLPYFVCGSFMFPATLRAVTHGLTLRGVADRMCPATLRGFERRCVPWAEWPAIVPVEKEGGEGEGAVVHGMMLFGIAESQRARVHRFEGGMFDLRRVVVQVEMEDGAVWNHEAGVYVWNGAVERLVSPEVKAWSPDMLLTSEWHLRNISLVAAEEERLDEAPQNSLAKDW